MTSSDIKREAIRLGFDLCGVAPAAAFPELRFLRAWLDQGYGGQMKYLDRTAERRSDVRHVLSSARSVIVAAMVYNCDRPYSTEIAAADEAHISRYAWGDDYHDVMGQKLAELVDWMHSASEVPFDAVWYVDTGPVQERVYAKQAGLGWIGKNTCLINPDLGSWVFLSEIVISLPLEPDEAGTDRCGTCTLCLEACPTGALVDPGVLDATRCISYQTIELKGAIPEDARDGVGTHVYGCDICQEVCPYNLRPAMSQRAEWVPRAEFDRPRLGDLWRMGDEDLRRALRGSAMERARLTGIRRNVAVAMGNSGRPELAQLLDAGAGNASREHHDTSTDASPSRDDPIVRDHVEWAKRKLRESP